MCNMGELPEGKLLLSVRDCVPILGVSRNLIYAACHRGELPTLRIGRRLLIPRRALEKLLSEAKPLNLTQACK